MYAWLYQRVHSAANAHRPDTTTADGGPWCWSCGVHRAYVINGLCPVCYDDEATRGLWERAMRKLEAARRKDRAS